VPPAWGSGGRCGDPDAGLASDGTHRRLDPGRPREAFATDAPASSADTRELLGWTPTHPTLLEDLETGDYIAPHAT
jgi:hypothetical protein